MIPSELSPPPYRLLADHLRSGRLVPFLGAGASTHPNGFPTGRCLAKQLAEHLGLLPDEVDVHDLLEVTSCFALYNRQLLEETLQQVFLRQELPGQLHSLLARIQAPLLILTTNYDTLIESGFREMGRPFHLVMTPMDVTEGRHVLWWPPGAKEPQRERGDRLLLVPEELPVIYKIHGGFDPVGKWHTSVVTEEDYFEIGGRIYETSLLPLQLRARLSESSLLFLGYSLRDMHVRHLVTTSNRWSPECTSYLVSKNVSKFDHRRFLRLGVQVYELEIETFVEELKSELGSRWGS
jgi:SIR2-like protein